MTDSQKPKKHKGHQRCQSSAAAPKSMGQEREKKPGPLSSSQGRALLRLARNTIAGKLGLAATESSGEELALLRGPELQEPRGTFVTLMKHGALRGCIGTLTASGSIIDGVRDNAVAAAFFDSRFSPLTREEFPAIDLSISILGQATPLPHASGEELLHRLQPGRDGVILGKGPRGATFLPQVWEQLPRPEDFLAHLCSKAGLAPEAWRQGDLEIATYRVQHFSEKEERGGRSPGGTRG